MKLSGLILPGVFLCTLIVSSCKKTELNESTAPSTMSAKDFNYSTEKEITYKLSLQSVTPGTVYRVNFYKSYDKKGEGLMLTRFIKGGEMASGKLMMPSYLKKVYTEVAAGNGSAFVEELNIQGETLIAELGVNTHTFKKSMPVSPGCAVGCDVSYTNYSSNLNINNNDPGNVFCFDGASMGNKHLNVNKDNVEIRICGNAVIKNLNLRSSAKLIINDGASLTVEVLSDQGAEIEIYDGSLTVNGNFTPGGKVTNHGSIVVNGELNINNPSGDFTNNGSVFVTGHLNNNNKLINNDSIYVKGHIHFNGSTQTYNHCFMYTEDRLQINSYFENYGYIGASLKVHINGGSQTEMYNGAMIHGLDGIFLNGTANGNGTTSMLKTTGYSHINGGAYMTGSLEFCDADGLEVNNGNVVAPADVACNAFIATNDCNPEGNGTPTCVDTDNDGVCDSNDCRPNDPAVAGCSCYPDCDNFATLAYEDLWPYSGDYDFNDMVMDYQYTILTNADNKVVRIEARYLVRAVGAKYKNGFGLELGVAPGAISSVSGQKYTEGYITNLASGAEAGQSKAVVVVFDNAHTALSASSGGTGFKNTLPHLSYIQPDTLDVVIHFGTPQEMADLGTAPYNPFVISNSKRGREIHLPDYEPTDLMDVALLGTGNDASVPASGTYYISTSGLPWVINIPESFDYPIEMESILDVYNYFDDWATSGGVTYPDWYKNLPGYRDNSKIY